MAQVQANGITIEYESVGEGEPLLLIMGLSAQLIAWPDGFVEHLVQRGFRVVRYDNRDSGLSTHSDQPPPSQRRVLAALLFKRDLDPPYHLADMTSDAVGLLDALGIESAHVVGASMGGMIAQDLAITHPGRVRSLTSIMSNTGDRKHGGPSRRLLARLFWLRRRMEATDPIGTGVEAWRLISGPHFDEAEVREMVERAYARSNDPDAGRRQTAAIASAPDRSEALGRVRTPVLVIHGLLDRLVKPTGGVATAESAPGARLLMFPDMAHDLPQPRWAEMADAIRANASRSAQPAGL
jgi:pimeloyl-ACP methyl ester carboxylesterase